MIVKCIIDSGENIPQEYIEIGYTPESKIDLVLDNKYVVYGICLWRGKLQYLISDECGISSWYPCVLFKGEDGRTPNCWQFRFINKADSYSVEAILGYPELVNSESHFDDLMEREEQAIAIFLQRKNEIDQETIGGTIGDRP